MPNEPLIQTENLTRFYSGTCAVNDVSFDLAKGEVMGFLGPNGAGKSTTMQIISGNLAPSAGSVRILGIDLLDQPKRAKAEIGYLPERPPVYRELSVNEYLDYCARLNRITRSARARAIATAKERCGLGAVGARLIGNLSKGYQQRVGIAQAIIHTPALVILDEPTVGLDPNQIREIRTLIRELGKDHGIILSTHILPEVQATCNRVQIIHQGKLVFADSMEGIERGLRPTSFLLRLENPPPVEALQGIEGVERTEVLADGHFRIHFREASPAEAMIAQAVNQHWRPSELAPERHTLEQIFIKLTVDEQHATAGEDAS